MAGDGTAADLTNAMLSTLLADAGVAALVEDRIYEYAQTGEAGFPFIALGEGQETDDSTDCGVASDAFVDVNVWSRPDTPSFEEAKTIASAVRAALHDASLTLADNRCVLIEHRITRYLRETDPPPMFRASITFHAIVEDD